MLERKRRREGEMLTESKGANASRREEISNGRRSRSLKVSAIDRTAIKICCRESPAELPIRSVNRESDGRNTSV